MTNKITETIRIQDLLAENNTSAIKDFCVSEHPGIVADSLKELDNDQIKNILKLVPADVRADIFTNFDHDFQTSYILSLSRTDAAKLLNAMPSDDRADLFQKLDDAQRATLYPALAKAEREDIRRLTSYPEGTAGAVMSSDYVALRKDMTIKEALMQIRMEAPSKETIYYAYVIDSKRHLIGIMSLKNLIVNDHKDLIEDVMHKDVIYARVDDDQEKAARVIQKYDLLALPVINTEGVLAGIITHDDALDVIMQEQQEDMEKLMAIQGSHQANMYLKNSAWTHFKNRCGWVVGLAIVGLVSGMVVHSFESTLSTLVILALYMPMIADTGGNTGSQSATVVIRAISLGGIKNGDIFKVLFKEFKISLMLAVILAFLTYGKVLFLSSGADIPVEYPLSKIAFAISMALGIQVISATLSGALLPMTANRLKLDPAVVASPAITTVVDVTGLLIYFFTVKCVLGI